MIWSGTRNGKFFIKALYSYLDSGGAKAFPTRVIWNPWVLLRVGLLLGKLLGKEGKVSLVNRCFMRKQEESIDHLLLYCAIAGLLWQLVFSLFGLQWVMCSSVRMMLLSWNGAQIGKEWQKAWLTALSCLF